MASSRSDDLGLGLLLLPVGLLFIVLVVGGLFLTVRDTSDTHLSKIPAHSLPLG